MTKKEFETIVPRIEERFPNRIFHFYYIEPFSDFCIHPFVWVDGDYFICLKYRKILDMMRDINLVEDKDHFYIHYKHVQKIRGLNEYNLKWIKCWERDDSKIIPLRKRKIQKIFKQLGL